MGTTCSGCVRWLTKVTVLGAVMLLLVLPTLVLAEDDEEQPMKDRYPAAKQDRYPAAQNVPFLHQLLLVLLRLLTRKALGCPGMPEKGQMQDWALGLILSELCAMLRVTDPQLFEVFCLSAAD